MAQLDHQAGETTPVVAALNPLRSTAIAATTLLAAVVLIQPAVAGTITGTATIRERIAVPPDAVFEAVLIDIARADAPATELGRVRLQPAGQSPFRFSIPYRDQDITPSGRYAVRATVRQGKRLLFTTDTIHPVLTGEPSQPLTLQLVQVDRRPRRGQTLSPLGRLPASWRGDLPDGGGTTRWQLDLSSNGTYQLRQTLLNRPAPNSFDDIGRWRLAPGTNRLVLRGGREAPLVFQPMDGGNALSKLDLQGQPITSGQSNRLQRLAAYQPIEPRLHLQGMLRYMADAPSIRLCATRTRLPVAMEGDYLALERAYLKALPAGAAGQPLLVNLDGLITSRPAAEPGGKAQRTLVVERFGGVHPGKGCPQQKPSATPAAALSAPQPRR